jgi:hypothetical protein
LTFVAGIARLAGLPRVTRLTGLARLEWAAFALLATFARGLEGRALVAAFRRLRAGSSAAG